MGHASCHSAEQAAAWGLVNRVIADSELMPQARALARDMLSVVPHTLAAYKSIINDGAALSYGDALALVVPGHSGDGGRAPVPPPSPAESTLAAALAGQTERGAPVDTAAELEAIRRLKYAYFRTLDLKQFDDLGALLTEDVTAGYEDGRTVLQGRTAIVAWLGEVLGDRGMATAFKDRAKDQVVDRRPARISLGDGLGIEIAFQNCVHA